MIITLLQVKDILGITGTAKDTLINTLIPEAEAKYLQIRNFPFMQIQGNITSGDKTVSNIRLYPITSLSGIVERSTVSFLNRMEYVYNSSYGIDNLITDIDVLNNTLEIDRNSTQTASDVIFTVYPQGSKLVSAKIVQYLMQKNSMNGLQSETVGSYSYSKGQASGNPFGVPDDIVKSIKRYMSA